MGIGDTPSTLPVSLFRSHHQCRNMISGFTTLTANEKTTDSSVFDIEGRLVSGQVCGKASRLTASPAPNALSLAVLCPCGVSSAA